MSDCSYCHGDHERADCPNVPTWRNEVIEECARVAEKVKLGIEPLVKGDVVVAIATAIRALKDIK